MAGSMQSFKSCLTSVWKGSAVGSDRSVDERITWNQENESCGIRNGKLGRSKRYKNVLCVCLLSLCVPTVSIPGTSLYVPDIGMFRFPRGSWNSLGACNKQAWVPLRKGPLPSLRGVFVLSFQTGLRSVRVSAERELLRACLCGGLTGMGLFI